MSLEPFSWKDRPALIEKLFPVQKLIPDGEKGFTTYTGLYVEYPKLTNIYKLKYDNNSGKMNVFDFMDDLQVLHFPQPRPKQ